MSREANPLRAFDLIERVAEIATAIDVQSGEPSIEYAGAIISHLRAHPEKPNAKA